MPPLPGWPHRHQRRLDIEKKNYRLPKNNKHRCGIIQENALNPKPEYNLPCQHRSSAFWEKKEAFEVIYFGSDSQPENRWKTLTRESESRHQRF